jgi:GNAT superfamily N-acetyltransferase
MRITSLGLRTDVALRVLEGAEVVDRGDHLVIRSLDNPGFWWGNFLLLDAVPEAGTAGTWLARFAAEFPAARHVALGVDTTDDQPVIPGEFLAAGLEPQRATVLTCADVRPPPHQNAAAEIRPLDSDADWQQSYELGVRCFGDDGAQDYLKRRAAARRRLARTGSGAWFGAFSGGRLLAQLGVCDAGGGFARYQDVETDPAARRQGLAGTLVWHAGRYGREILGASTLVIVADPADLAIRIYRACGFTDLQSQLTFERPPAG